MRQKVLGANIHETEGLLERIIALRLDEQCLAKCARAGTVDKETPVEHLLT